MENKMDSDFDFRVGDVVCDIRFGTGKVVEIKSSNYSLPIRVDFGGYGCVKYRVDGKCFDLDKLRLLHHGTWEQVFGNLPNLKPKRKAKRWVNLCDDGSWTCFNSKDEAEKAACRSICLHIAVAIEIKVDE